MQFIKNWSDELALLENPIDEEDFIHKILDGPGEHYKEIVNEVNARETPISFNEIHEKLINKEASLEQSQALPSSFPATANHVYQRNNKSWRPSTVTFHSQGQRYNSPHDRPPPRPYFGCCQGHTVKRCSLIWLVTIQSSSAPSTTHSQASLPTPWQPCVQFVSFETTDTPAWLLDSETPHNVTADLNNLSLYTLYVVPDDVVIGDGSGLHITHTGSISLPTRTRTFNLDNIFCVPNMKKNLISIYLFCDTNHVSIEFLPTIFHVKDLTTGGILLIGKTKNSVYEWPTSSPKSSSLLVAFSSIKTISFELHRKLGRPSSSILQHIISNFSLPYSMSQNSYCNVCLSDKSHRLPSFT